MRARLSIVRRSTAPPGTLLVAVLLLRPKSSFILRFLEILNPLDLRGTCLPWYYFLTFLHDEVVQLDHTTSNIVALFTTVVRLNDQRVTFACAIARCDDSMVEDWW